MSNPIYNQLTPNFPYVYLGIHKTQNYFYIGYRESNAMPSNLDLGFKYSHHLQE